jgi:DMSO/TMAO reductase YedYZ molybdopterin-dependent catalytic subunit
MMSFILSEEKPGHRIIDKGNCEPPSTELGEFTTSKGKLFTRWVGEPRRYSGDPNEWILTISGIGANRPISFTLGELKTLLANRIVSQRAVLECAGNGRSGFVPAIKGTPWHNGAVGCPEWTGFRLSDVLALAEPNALFAYTGHLSHDADKISRGIPAEKALARETMLAFAMNGEALTDLHGAPLRLVVPGYPGSAWQKCVSEIVLSDREWNGAKMDEYRMFGKPIIDMPVKSLITSHDNDFEVKAGVPFLVSGRAWSGHIPLSHVKCSIDGGNTWTMAGLEVAEDRFAWRCFTFLATGHKEGPLEIMARAFDVNGNKQPMTAEECRNPLGYLNHAVHRVKGRVAAPVRTARYSPFVLAAQ